MTAPEGRLRLELYVRSLAPQGARGRQEAVVERLNRLIDEGVADEYDLLVWGRGAPASPAAARTQAGLFALNRVAVFSAWAERNSLSLDDHFRRTIVDSEVTAERYRMVRFPIMTLAEYRGADLTFVTPVRGPDGHFTVLDRLETLLEADTPADVTPEEPLDRVYATPPPGLRLVPGEDPSSKTR